MSNWSLDVTLKELAVPAYIEHARQTSLAQQIAATTTSDTELEDPERLPRLGYIYESLGVRAYERSIGTNGTNDLKQARYHFDAAFACWTALSSLPLGYSSSDLFSFVSEGVSYSGLKLVETELQDPPLSAELNLAFRIAVAGLVAHSVPETRLELQEFDLASTDSALYWSDHVAQNVFSAFALLVRKGGGWNDIENALIRIDRLRALQQEYEDDYLTEHDGEELQLDAAVELVGLYHLAQLITISGEYLRGGASTVAHVLVRIDRHHERSTKAFMAARRTLLGHLGDLLWIGCRELVSNSIWTHVQGVGESVRDFARALTLRGRPNPVIELWPGQQMALQRNLLDPYRRAIIVEMPTSAGKTLLAQFAIVQTHALNPHGTIAYIVPTRALVNQVTLDLRADFRDLEATIRVEQAVPAFELDPTEERLLGTSPHVLVTTPEKLDLLVRRDHPATRNLTLVIADEAHNLNQQERGARLELLLGMIKRDRANARFLLLSPFLPNARELVAWLGDDRALDPIHLDWKPARKIVGVVRASGRSRNRQLILETLPAAGNTDIDAGVEIPVGSGQGVKNTVGDLSQATVRSLLNRGSVLILCRGKGTSISRAKELSSLLPKHESSRMRDAVCRYIEAEAGRKTTLVDCIQHGVAYHHAGLSHETRWLIEGLIRKGLVSVVCGTTTLAQGMNFPVTTVVVETLQKGDKELTYDDFWNIAGRAGRTLVDSFGVIAFPQVSAERRAKFIDFLRDEALEISSQLADLISSADEIAEQFSMRTLFRWPKLAALLQFLAHAMRVAGDTNVADEVEDIMRASLVYHQTRAMGKDASEQLIRLCRAYVAHVQGITGQRGVLSLADHTGFSTPSVLSLLAEKSGNSELSRIENWHPDRLFGESLDPLTQRIATIASLPEMRLGQGDEMQFNPGLVAAILRDWVKGEPLDTLAERYWRDKTVSDPDERISKFSNYLFSSLLGRASWGIGALEGIALSGIETSYWTDAAYVPSMIFFGVNQKEAIWLRMVGVPRFAADNLAQLWKSDKAGEPQTYEEIRGWVSDLSDTQWDSAIPSGSGLTATDMRLLWEEFGAG